MVKHNGKKGAAMENKKVVILLILILISVITIYLSRGDDVPLLTSEQVALNYSQFFSTKHNEPNMKKGEFQLFPWKNDKFQLYSEAIPEMQKKETTKKEESDGGRKLIISTETAYWFESFYLGPDEPQQIKMVWNNEEITVPVYVKILVSRSSIGQKSALYLSGLTDDSHLYKLRVASPPGGNSTKFNPNAIFEHLPNIKAWDLRYLPDILGYSTTDAWLGEWRKMAYWKLLKENPLHQKSQKEGNLSEEERRLYYKMLDQIMEQARKQAGEVIPPFSPTVLVDNGVIFTIPVIIEEINGVKISYQGD